MTFAPHTEDEIREMLATIGRSSLDELFDQIPEDVRIDGSLRMPAGVSEMELIADLRDLAARNRSLDELTCFAGHRDEPPVAITGRNFGDEDGGGLLSSYLARCGCREHDNAHQDCNSKQQQSDTFHTGPPLKHTLVETFGSLHPIRIRWAGGVNHK